MVTIEKLIHEQIEHLCPLEGSIWQKKWNGHLEMVTALTV